MIAKPSHIRSMVSLHRFLILLALVMLVGHVVVYFVYAANLIQFPFDYDQGEGFELVDTTLFSQGQWPYRSTETYPFYSSNYPPLFHVMAAPLAAAFGPAYWYGRLLGFAGTLVTAITIGYAVYREGRHRWIALAAGLAFLGSNTIYHIGPLFRQHMTMVLFETLAVVLLATSNEIADRRQRRMRLALGLGLILAAGYTKQLAAVTALATGIFLLIRQPKRAIVWGFLAGAAGTGIFIWMNAATGGEWWRQAILANVNELKIIQTLALFRQWFGLHGFLIVPAVVLVIYELYFARLSLYAIWFVVAVLINGTASGTWGGGDSYFATAIAATCILSGIFFSRIINRDWNWPENYLSRRLIRPAQRNGAALAKIALVIVPLVYLSYGRAVLKMPTEGPIFGPMAHALGIQPNALNGLYDSARTADGQFAGGYANIGHLTTAADVEAGWQIVELIRETPMLVLSEDAGFSLMAGREVITNPTQLLNLEKKGLYDGAQLVRLIEDRQFGLIILRAQFFPEGVLKAIAANYQQTDSIAMNGFAYLILRPRP